MHLVGYLLTRYFKDARYHERKNLLDFFALILLSLKFVVRLVRLLLSIREAPGSHFGPVMGNIF